MMQVLVYLVERLGLLVTREELLEHCWNGQPVGDDSLNRAVAGIRRAARQVGARSLQITTVAGAGYVLSILAADQGDEADRTRSINEAVAVGWRSWRLGLPEPDRFALRLLQRTLSVEGHDAEGWAALALLLRHAAEHAEPGECVRYVEECLSAAEIALALRPNHHVAKAALASLPPLFGDWLQRRTQLLAILDEQGNCAPAMHDLAILEMATGRPSAAVPLIEQLLEREPVAAIFLYKRVYHLWTLGRLSEMDQVADRAMQLWPRHPAIWFARFWTLALTGRPNQALQQLGDEVTRPDIPPPALQPLEQTALAIQEPANEQARRAAVNANLQAASRGPAQSVAAIIHLSGLGASDEAFAVAENYLTRTGTLSVSLRKTSTDPSITDQHRRVTQMLFIPSAEAMRRSSRFDTLCQTIGLTNYWQQTRLKPDHRL
jgi:tetratricopeptide (TPR) repeat protein